MNCAHCERELTSEEIKYYGVSCEDCEYGFDDRVEPMNWAKEQRLEFIAKMLHVYGFINREHLVKMFRISIPQAAGDFRTFKSLHPGRMEYDTSRKCYVPAAT